MANFTPGPWRYERYLGNDDSCFVRGPNDERVCGQGSGQVREANARLIAAAPALYEALELFVIHLERQNGSTWGLDADEINRLDRGKSALKQARGEGE